MTPAEEALLTPTEKAALVSINCVLRKVAVLFPARPKDAPAVRKEVRRLWAKMECDSSHWLVDAARSVWVFHTALVEEAADALEAGRPMPEEIRRYAAGVLRGTEVAPPKRPDVRLRNHVLCLLIQIVADMHRLSPTRHDGKDRESVCSLLVEGAGLSESSLNRIWQHRAHYGAPAALEAMDSFREGDSVYTLADHVFRIASRGQYPPMA